MEELSTLNLRTVHPTGMEPAEALIAVSFHRVFHLANAYYDDPTECLALANAVMRHAEVEADFAINATVHRALELIFDRVLDTGTLPGLPLEALHCWMLKDSSDLNYNEIGYILGLDRDAVRTHIAAVRNHLLDSGAY